MKKMLIKLAVVMSILGMFAAPTALAASDVVKLAILPFKINADQDLTFLQKGIVDMLTSRLSRPGSVEVLDSRNVLPVLESFVEDIDPTTAKEIGGQLGVDHVLFGSITSIGEAISVDARVVDVQKEAFARPFYIQAANLGEVIPKINGLTAEINQQIFGLEVKAEAPQTVASPPVASYRTHPEKQFKQKKSSAPSPVPALTSKKGPFNQPIQPQEGQFWRSQTFNLALNGLAIGDVDGDGQNETVMISDNQIFIYRLENGSLVKVNDTQKYRGRIFIGVDMADINANGRPEIFITALDIGKSKVRSMILEFDGLAYETIEKDSPWYYRVSTSPGRDAILLGQKAVDEDPYAAAIYQLEWNGRDYEPDQQIVPKKTTNALGCVIGDLLKDGSLSVAAFSDSDAVQIFDNNGQLLNDTNDGYGGSTMAVNLPVDSKGEPPPLRYLPMRMMINDLNSDGQNELVLVKNEELTGKHLARFRMFTKTQIVGLNWDGAGLAEIWQTRQLSGRVADFAVADLEGDGRQDLVAILVAKEGRIVGMKAKVNLIAFPLATN